MVGVQFSWRLLFSTNPNSVVVADFYTGNSGINMQISWQFLGKFLDRMGKKTAPEASHTLFGNPKSTVDDFNYALCLLIRNDHFKGHAYRWKSPWGTSQAPACFTAATSFDLVIHNWIFRCEHPAYLLNKPLLTTDALSSNPADALIAFPELSSSDRCIRCKENQSPIYPSLFQQCIQKTPFL